MCLSRNSTRWIALFKFATLNAIFPTRLAKARVWRAGKEGETRGDVAHTRSTKLQAVGSPWENEPTSRIFIAIGDRIKARTRRYVSGEELTSVDRTTKRMRAGYNETPRRDGCGGRERLNTRFWNWGIKGKKGAVCETNACAPARQYVSQLCARVREKRAADTRVDTANVSFSRD